jgi:hypothetical protein
MLTPEQVKPHLLHEDRWIRRAALDYFAESWSLDPQIAGLALTAHVRYFKPGEFPQLELLHHLSFDASTAERVLSLLDSAPSRVVIQLNWCLGLFSPELLRKLGGLLQDHPRLDDEARQKICFRLKLGDLSDEELWQELQRFSGRARMRPMPHLKDPRADPLIAEVAARKTPGDASVCDMLRSRSYHGTYFEALLMDLAGARKLKAAVPHLLDRLQPDDDGFFQLANHVRALERIGDPGTVELIQDRWPELDQREAASILGRIKTPESEEALLELFDEDDDPDLRFYITEALLNLFSGEAVGPVRALLAEPGFDRAPEIQDKLLPVIDLLGIRLTEAEAWRKDRQERLDRLPSSEVEPREALEAHRQVLDALAEMDQVQGAVQAGYEELGRRLTRPRGEEEEEEAD